MDDGKELADVVGAVDRTIVENLLTSLRSMHWYSIGPGLPEQAASTAQAFAFTSLGKGNTVSFLHEGGFTGILFIFSILLFPVDYCFRILPSIKTK